MFAAIVSSMHLVGFYVSGAALNMSNSMAALSIDLGGRAWRAMSKRAR